MVYKSHDDHDRHAHKFLHIQDSDDHPHPLHVHNGGIFKGQSSDIFQDIVDQLMFQDIVNQLKFLSNIRLLMAQNNQPSKEDLCHDTSNNHTRDDTYDLHSPNADHHMDAHNDHRI